MKGMWGIYLHSFFMFLEKDLELLLLEKLQQISCVFLLHYKKLKQTKVDFSFASRECATDKWSLLVAFNKVAKDLR